MKNLNASENMTKKLITVSWHEPIEKASRLMEMHRIRHLPVLDSQAKVVGILSDRDVLRATNPSRLGFSPTAVIGDFMSWPVVTVSASTPVRQIAEGMIDEKLSAFLVTKGKDEVVGIVTTEDLLRLLIKLMKEEGAGVSSAVAYNPLVHELIQEMECAGI